MTSLLEVKLTWAAPMTQETNTRLQCMKEDPKKIPNHSYRNTDINGLSVQPKEYEFRDIVGVGDPVIDNEALVRWLSAFDKLTKTIFTFSLKSEGQNLWIDFNPQNLIIQEALALLPGAEYKSARILSFGSLVKVYLHFT